MFGFASLHNVFTEFITFRKKNPSPTLQWEKRFYHYTYPLIPITINVTEPTFVNVTNFPFPWKDTLVHHFSRFPDL